MGTRRKVVLALLIAAFLVATAAAFAGMQASTQQASVLILLPGQPGLPAASLMATGIRSALLSEWSFRISIETELVDIDRFATPEAEENRLRALHPSKYAGRPFDLVITASNAPLRFALRVRDELWPGIPVIACAVDERGLRGVTVPRGVTVVTVRFDMDGTLAAALALLPDTRTVALVGGAAPQDRFMHDLARAAIRASGRRLNLIDLTSLPIVDLMDRITRLPEHTVVLVSSYQMDASGRRLWGLEIVDPLTTAANRPAFNMFSQVLGRGIVGGSVLDFEAVGREAGALALRVLRGQALPASPMASAVVSVPRFDGRQLARWNIDEGRLPPGSEVLNAEQTLWQQYRWHAAVALALIGIQAALIIALVVERHQRRAAQARLAERLRLEALVSEIGATLAVAPARVGEQITDGLRRVVTFLGVDGGVMWKPSADGNLFEVTHAWTTEGVPAPPSRLDVRRFTFFMTCLTPVDGVMSFERLDDLPQEAVAEHAAFAEGGVQSLAAIPLHAGDQLVGFLAFAALRGTRAWPADLIQQLRGLAEYFASAIMRAQSAAALESSTALTAAVLAALPGETALINAEGTILQTNEAWASAARQAPANVADALAVGANYLYACRESMGLPRETGKRVEAGIDAVLRREREDFSLEYPTSRQRQDRWMEVRVRRVAILGGGAAVTHLDVTKRRRDEAAGRRDLSDIAHLDRVAAMGHLASSIAHELNQPLAAILTNAQAANRMLTDVPPDMAEVQACLVDIISDDQRAAKVLQRMRGLLKKEDFVALPVALNDLIVNTMGLVANDALLHGVSIEFTPASMLPMVYGDLVQIQQVILNLLTNAIVAASAAPTVRSVTVRTALVPPSHVELAVHDSGAGIPEEVLARLFEPFFTTRSEGLGMGLAIARKIVEAHDGQILAENDPSGGAIFRVHLPTRASDSEDR